MATVRRQAGDILLFVDRDNGRWVYASGPSFPSFTDPFDRRIPRPHDGAIIFRTDLGDHYVWGEAGQTWTVIGGGGGASVTSSEFSALEVRVSALSGAPGGGSVTSTELSAVSAQAASALSQHASVNTVDHLSLANAISVVSNALSNEISNRQSAVNAVSQGLSALSDANSAAHASLAQAISIVSNAASAADAHASTASVAATSVNSRVTSVNTFLCALSVRTSLAGASVHGLQSILDAISQRISVEAPVGGGGGSVTSTELSAVSAQAASALSQALSVLSVTDAAMSVNILSLQSTVSNLRSAVSNVSAQSAGGSATGLQAVVDMLSNKISQAGGGGGSVSPTSNAFSVISQHVSAAVGVSAQLRTRANVVSVFSATTLAPIQSMNVSLEAGGLYQIYGKLVFECATSGGFYFGCSVPAAASNNPIKIGVVSAGGVAQISVGYRIGVWTQSATHPGAATTIVSTAMGTLNALTFMDFEAMIAASAAGQFELMVRTSVAGASMSVRNGYIRSLRIS